MDSLTYSYWSTGSIAYDIADVGNPVLFAALRSEKFKPREFNGVNLPSANIGAHVVNEETWRFIDDVFLTLNLKWRVLPSDDME